MIGKVVKGKSFRKVLKYLHEKEGAELIGGNMIGKTPQQLLKEFSYSRALNPGLKKPVFHVSLSLSRHEEQTEEQWKAIAQDYIEGMDFGECQYAVYRHHDQEHDHIHIVASRTTISEGNTVSDSWDYLRSENLLRQLEASYNLQVVQPSIGKEERSPTTGEFRFLERTGNPSVRFKLQAILKESIAPQQTLPQFIGAIQSRGVSVKLSRKTAGISGISYGLDGISLSGTHLGRDFTFPGLQKHRKLSYLPSRDDEAIANLLANPAPLSPTPESISTPPVLDPLQKQAAEAIAPIAATLFETAHREGSVVRTGDDIWTLSGNQYTVVYDKPEERFRILAQDGRGELIRLCNQQGVSEVEMAQHLHKEDIERFQQIQQFLQAQGQKHTQAQLQVD